MCVCHGLYVCLYVVSVVRVTLCVESSRYPTHKDDLRGEPSPWNPLCLPNMDLQCHLVLSFLSRDVTELSGHLKKSRKTQEPLKRQIRTPRRTEKKSDRVQTSENLSTLIDHLGCLFSPLSGTGYEQVPPEEETVRCPLTVFSCHCKWYCRDTIVTTVGRIRLFLSMSVSVGP